MQREGRIVTQPKSLFQCLTMASVTKSFQYKHTFFRNSENPTGICKHFIDVNHQQKVTYTQLVDICPSKVPSQRLHLLSPLP